MGCTIKTSFCSRVIFSMRSPVAMSNGCAPVWASYPAITSFTSSMSAVAGSYSRSVLSPSDENVRILALMFDLLRDVNFRFPEGEKSGGFGSLRVILHRFSELSRQLFRTHDSERPGPRPTVPRRQQKTLSCGFQDGMREENTSGNARLFSKARW